MISNPKGWRNRRAAAMVRKQEKEARAELNAQRWMAFQGLVEGKPEESAPAEPEPVSAPEEPGLVDVESLSNAELRQSLESRGFEVPKTTARARLIELYKDKVK